MDYSKPLQDQDKSIIDKKSFRSLTLRLQGITFNIYSKNLFESTHPNFQAEILNFNLENQENNFHQNNKYLNATLKSLEVSALI
jgi:hypothetical protein